MAITVNQYHLNLQHLKSIIPNMDKLVILLSLLSACLPAAYPWHYYRGELPDRLAVHVMNEESTKETCESQKVKEFKDKITEIGNDLGALVQKVQDLELGKQEICACQQPTSCADILKKDPNAVSDHYLIQKSDCSKVRVYCDMTFDCKGVVGGWMKVCITELATILSNDNQHFKIKQL